MSIWAIVLIGLAVAMAVGPVMMFKPSKRDRRLAKLRQQAALEGLKIRMAKQELPQGDRQVAVYCLPVDIDKISPWQLLRQEYEHGVHFHRVWELQSADSIPQEIASDLRRYLDTLPESIVGVEASEKQVGVWWLERANSEGLSPVLTALQSLSGILRV